MSTYKRIFSLVLIVVFTCQLLQAQMTSSGWVNTVSSSGFETVSDIKTDDEGNIYTIGGYSGTANFNGLSSSSTLASAGERDVFITKHSTDGELIWVTSFGGGADDLGFSVDINNEGEVYAVGYFEETAIFDASTSITSSGREDIFVAKLDSDGVLNWVKQIGGTNTDEANSVAIDKNGDIYVVGRFVGSVDFDPDSGTETLQSFGGPDAFVLKLNGEGEFIWAYDIGTGGNEECEAVGVDNENNVIITGIFDSTIDFDPGPGEVELFGDGAADPFYLKLTPDGSLIWVRSFTSTGFVYSADVDIDEENNIITHGFFWNDMNFEPSNSNGVIQAIGAEDCYTAKFDSDGNLMWSNILGGANIEFGYGVAVDEIGAVYVTGFYYDDPDFDPSDDVFSLPSANLEDTYIVKYDSQGNFVWAKRTGGPWSDSGYGIDISPTGDVLIAGTLWEEGDLDPEVDGVLNIESAGSADLFILKIDQIVSSTDDNPFAIDISISPNPTKDYLTIKSNSSTTFSVTFLNELGIAIGNSFTLNNQEKTIDLQSLPSGIYYLILDSGKEKTVKKIVKM